jgi:membrane protein implicated in regulation of membrane protease activity
MTVVFLVCFIGGLLLAVRVMLFGVERTVVAPGEHGRSIRFSLPLVSTFAVVFGIVGYLVSRSGSRLVATLVAIVIGAAASVLSGRMVARWATIPPEHDDDDERYVLQGHPARATAPIALGREGEITYDTGRGQRLVRARLVGDNPIDTGTEVVIERIEDDVAYVESWLQVEKRL